MISIKECKEILKNTGDDYSDDQLKDILDLFELWSKIIYKQVKEEKHEKKSDIVRQGIN